MAVTTNGGPVRKVSLLGILGIVASGLVMLLSMISGIYYFAGNLYVDMAALPVSLRKPGTVQEFRNIRMETDGTQSIWLHVPNRRLENKKFQVRVELAPDDGGTPTMLEESFRWMITRNSAGRGQFYRIGLLPEKPFSGTMRFATEGEHVPPFDGQLVLRRFLGWPVPWGALGWFILGVVGLVMSIRRVAGRIDRR